MTNRVDSWNPFDLTPRTKWYQGLYVGLLWAALAWLLVILAMSYFGIWGFFLIVPIVWLVRRNDPRFKQGR